VCVWCVCANDRWATLPTSAVMAASVLWPWAHVSVKREREGNGGGRRDDGSAFPPGPHGGDREGGERVMVTDGGGRRDVGTGDGGPSLPRLVTPAALALNSDG
jgi:hypothetical protein